LAGEFVTLLLDRFVAFSIAHAKATCGVLSPTKNGKKTKSIVTGIACGVIRRRKDSNAERQFAMFFEGIDSNGNPFCAFQCDCSDEAVVARMVEAQERFMREQERTEALIAFNEEYYGQYCPDPLDYPQDEMPKDRRMRFVDPYKLDRAPTSTQSRRLEQAGDNIGYV
jgi:hypothetical protein